MSERLGFGHSRVAVVCLFMIVAVACVADVAAQNDAPNVLGTAQANSQQMSVASPATVARERGSVYAFINSADDAGRASLRAHLSNIDVLLPSWMHLTESAAMVPDDEGALAEMVTDLHHAQSRVQLMPIISSFDGYAWRSDLVQALVSGAEANRVTAISQFRDAAVAQSFQGLTVDFQQFDTGLMADFETFITEFAMAMHAAGLKLNVVVPLDDPVWDAAKLAQAADAVVLTAYDRFRVEDGPAGPLAPQDWMQSAFQERAGACGTGRLVIALANFGIDWQNGVNVETHTFSDVMLRARQAKAIVQTDPASLNPTFRYRDIDDQPREVWYLDAITAYNHLSAARKLCPETDVALWELGSEDPAVWPVIAGVDYLDPHGLTVIDAGYSVEYHGSGEVLRVASPAKPGRRHVSYDRTRDLITSQSIDAYPLGFEVARWGRSDQKQIVLTFDDGPDPVFTPQILDVLKRHDVKAVFFVLGIQAMRYPEIVKRILKEGHEVGNHTFSHPYVDRISDVQLRMELNATQRIITVSSGRATLLFRPPYGEDAEPQTADQMRMLLAASEAGYLTVSNHIDSKDWLLAQHSDIIDRVLTGARQNYGHIILFHDGGGNRAATVQALPTILETLRSEGFTFATASQLIGLSRDEIMPPSKDTADPFSGLELAGYTLARYIETVGFIGFALALVLTLTRALLIILLARRRTFHSLVAGHAPTVCAIVPAYNEENVVGNTVHSLLNSDYANLQIIVVDDGSSDGTFDTVKREFAGNPRVQAIRKENGGKSSALNLGISLTDAEIVILMDADTIFQPDTVSRMIAHFEDFGVGAVAGNAKVGNRINLITRWQALEYVVAQNLDRRAFECLNCITVVPGAVGAWRRDVVNAVGGFHDDTLAEDADLTIRVIRAGYRVEYEDCAIAWTEAPATVKSFLKQRFRWTYGMMQVALKHLDALFSQKPNSVGLVAIPNILIFQLLLPCVAPIADLMLVLALLGGLLDATITNSGSSEGLVRILMFYGIFFVVDLLVATIAFWKEPREQKSLLILLVPQRFFHRQLLYWVVLKAILAAIRGRAVSWYKLQRMATVKAEY